MLKLSASDSLQIIKRKKITKEGYACDEKYKDRKETTRLKWKKLNACKTILYCVVNIPFRKFLNLKFETRVIRYSNNCCLCHNDTQ